MEDPFVVARAIGASVPLALIAFFGTRKLCGPAGASELARLNRLAGVEGAEQQSRAGLLLRDWLPWLVAALSGTLAFLYVIVRDRIENGPRFSVADVPQLTAGFLEGCQKSCKVEGAAAELCQSFCACTLNAIRSQHPSDQDFARWSGQAIRDRARTEAEVKAANAYCLTSPTTPPNPSPTLNPNPVVTPAAVPSAYVATPGVEPLVGEFMGWATQARSDPTTVGTTEICTAAPAPTAGLCDRSKTVTGFAGELFSVTYHPQHARAVRLSTTFDSKVRCSDLAPSRSVREWDRDERHKQSCIITSGALAAMQLLLVHQPRTGTTAFLFFPEYLAFDPAFQALVLREGT